MPPYHVVSQLVIDTDRLLDLVWRRQVKHGMNISMDRNAPLVPEPIPFAVARAGRYAGDGPQQQASLGGGNDEQQGQIQETHKEDVYLVEPARRDDPSERHKNEHGQNVEGWLISKDGVRFDTLEGLYSVAVLNLGGRIGDDGAESVGQH